MPVRSQSPLEKKYASISNAKEDLVHLKNKLTPSQKKTVLKEQMSGNAKGVLKKIDSFDQFEDVLLDEKGGKKLNIIALVGLLAWFLKPEKKDSDSEEKKVSERKTVETKSATKSKKDDEVIYADIHAKRVEDINVKYATISPKASPEVVLVAIETNAKNLDQIYKRYLKTGDLTELRYFIFMAVTAKESGPSKNNKWKLRLVNQAAVGPRTRKKLLKKFGIKVPPLKGSNYLFQNEAQISTYESFKERVFSVFNTTNAGDAAQILSRCAIGKYQVLPIYWVNGVKHKKKMGDAELRVIYDYIKDANLQQKTAMRIIDGMGKRHNWNPAYVMVEYYAGERGVKLLKQNNSAINRKQYGGHGSIMDYVKRTTALANRLISQSRRKA